MSEALKSFTSDLCDTVNNAYSAGLTPQQIFHGMAGTIAATAYRLGAEERDVFNLFSGFAYGFRPKPLYDHATPLREASPCTESALGMKGLRPEATRQGSVY